MKRFTLGNGKLEKRTCQTQNAFARIGNQILD